MNEFAFQSAVNLVKAIQAKRISSSELLELYIARYERLNPRINAIVATNLENARIRANQADEALAKGEIWGPLHGLPITIKDLIEVDGMHCTWGSPIFKNYISRRNADVVQSLLDAGAIVYGKTNVPLWGTDTQTFNEIYGQTNNPWDVTRTPGGSSGGSAAALAAGLTSLEIGSDIGGSIRLPAHFCGVYGHKPTYGIVPMNGQTAHLDLFENDYVADTDIAVTGPMARSAEDLGLVMDLIVRPPRSQRKAIKIKLPEPRKKNMKEYRIGLWIDDPHFPPDTEVGDCLHKMANNLTKAGAKIQEKKPDIDFGHNLDLYFNLEMLTSVRWMPQKEFDQILKKSKSLDNSWIPQKEFDQMLQSSKTLENTDVGPEAYRIRNLTKLHREWELLNHERSKMRQKWDDYFQDFDVLLCPAVRVSAVQHARGNLGTRRHKFDRQDLWYGEVIHSWTSLTNVSYLPATVAPVGLTKTGLPVGVQIVGPYLEDHTSIHFAKLMEEALGGFSPPPGYE